MRLASFWEPFDLWARKTLSWWQKLEREGNLGLFRYCVRGERHSYCCWKESQPTLLQVNKKTIHVSVSAIIFPVAGRGWCQKSSKEFLSRSMNWPRGSPHTPHGFLTMRLVTPISLSTASGIWRWLFCQKRQLSPRKRSEGNCQVCQSANSYTMGETSLGINQLPATASSLVITTPRTSRIYILLKIHKPYNPGRPIVPACSCPTELISMLLDKIVAPVVRSLPSYIKDSRHAL